MRGAQTRSKSRPLTVEDLYGAGYAENLMKPEYSERKDIHELIQKRHRSGRAWIDGDGNWSRNGHVWPVPYGVRQAMRTPLVHAQIVNKYPWMVTWVSPKTNKRLKKKFMSLPSAIDFIASKAQHVDPQASVYSRHGFYIPTKLMGKFPRRSPRNRLYYWCPRCMQPRIFRRTDEVFHGQKKFRELDRRGEWTGGYEFRDVKLAVIACTHCGITNRDHKFRASNQPVEKRRFKQGVRRARKRRR